MFERSAGVTVADLQAQLASYAPELRILLSMHGYLECLTVVERKDYTDVLSVVILRDRGPET